MQDDSSGSVEVSRSFSGSPSRIAWLDLMRLLCAVQILGFHWLRAAVKIGSFAPHLTRNFITDYWHVNCGLRQGWQRFFVDDSASILHRWLYDTLDVLFGFGWEAVHVFILLSGLSLALALETNVAQASWTSWMLRRLKRLLLPFYVISLPLVAMMMALLFLSAKSPSPMAQEMHRKLVDNIGPDLSGLLFSQLLLFDPHRFFGTTSFLAPAWWFVPAILVAYLFFPLQVALLRRLRAPRYLVLSLLVSVVSYTASGKGWLPEFSWNYVIMNDCFNFALGIVLGTKLATAVGRKRVEAWFTSPFALLCGAALLLAGNLCNLYLATYPVSRSLFTAGLALWIAAVANVLVKLFSGWSQRLPDSYTLYLIHQPFAYPLALLSLRLFGTVAAFAGLIVYLASMCGLGALVDRGLKRLYSLGVKRRMKQLSAVGSAG